jgi:hypothetical protein
MLARPASYAPLPKSLMRSGLGCRFIVRAKSAALRQTDNISAKHL